MITKRKKNLSSTLFSFVLAGVAVLVVGFLIYTNFKINQKRTELYSQIERLKTEIERLQQRNQELQAGILRVKEEDFLERQARKRFQLKKPGEQVVTILPKEKKEPEKKESWWQKFLKKFGF